MPLNIETKNLFFSLQNTPFVGLINKETKHIVLAPCIPQKVRLRLNETGKVTSGMFINDNFLGTLAVNEAELNGMRILLEQNYVPRLMASDWDEKSSHECLFEQQCQSTKRSEWGGFGITLDALGTLNYTFVSGAFNSPSKKREKGALLSGDLIADVKSQTQELGPEPQNIEINAEPAPPISYDSPVQKRSRYGLFTSASSSATHHESLEAQAGTHNL
jgi:hypothetical protein